VTTTRSLCLAVTAIGAWTGVAQASEPSAHVAIRALPPIAPCVLQAPAERRLLQHLEERIDLYTHPCSGGIYLVVNAPDAAPSLEHSLPLLQGWWLHEFVDARWTGADSIEICGRFITGIGPSGATPFAAVIRARRGGKRWDVDEPTLADDRPGRAGGGETVCE